MILPILKYGAPELSGKNERVERFDAALETIVKNMFETLYGAPGIGLAAPQIGINIQLTTIDLSVGKEEAQRIVICNPEIVSARGIQKEEEGCLSFPGFFESVARPETITVKGMDIKGEPVMIEADGLLARCLSHEIDHLNGVLFVEHLSALKRTLIRNKIKKMAKAGEW
ncbi:MAG TPA: peptide deformylase [Acidobacteriota bacterium]|nr:peptide deformylase [Acidobacteriota bacterium]